MHMCMCVHVFRHRFFVEAYFLNLVLYMATVAKDS